MRWLLNRLNRRAQQKAVFGSRIDRCVRQEVVFRCPTREEALYYERGGATSAVWRGLAIGAYFDYVEWIADVEGQRWIIGENIWFDFPDTSPYAFVVLERDEKVWAATNFDDLPEAWRLVKGRLEPGLKEGE